MSKQILVADCQVRRIYNAKVNGWVEMLEMSTVFDFSQLLTHLFDEFLWKRGQFKKWKLARHFPTGHIKQKLSFLHHVRTGALQDQPRFVKLSSLDSSIQREIINLFSRDHKEQLFICMSTVFLSCCWEVAKTGEENHIVALPLNSILGHVQASSLAAILNPPFIERSLNPPS